MPAEPSVDGVSFTHLDEPLFDGAGASKRDLVMYLDAVAVPLVEELHDRPLSVIRVHRGEAPFMQKNVPSYTPSWVRTVTMWAETSRRDVSYALCNDPRTLLWFGNQRAIEFHPALFRTADEPRPLYLVLDLDPPGTAEFARALQAALLVREVLRASQMDGAIKTSGAKGVHVFVPLADGSFEDVALATRAVAARAESVDQSLATTAFLKEDRGGRVFLDATRAGGATVAAAYSPRIRPGVPVSFPLDWGRLDGVSPQDYTIHTAPRLIGSGDPWREWMPAPQALDPALVDEGRSLPVPRVQAMHEGRRRARARRIT
ncbi:MAG: ATP-dependent DNA ligase [Candidatus Dormibacteraeota bacterium]|nr:ATP-dependent DNA ligase [Candidatus Dormibacteraeota bacterium]